MLFIFVCPILLIMTDTTKHKPKLRSFLQSSFVCAWKYSWLKLSGTFALTTSSTGAFSETLALTAMIIMKD